MNTQRPVASFATPHARWLLLLCVLTACNDPVTFTPSPDAATDAGIDAPPPPPPPASTRAELVTAGGRVASARFVLEVELGLPVDQAGARGADHVLSSAAAVHP